MKPWLSTTPVLGDSKAAWHCSAGSSARACAASSHCTGTPLAEARSCKRRKAPCSASLLATVNLPQLRCSTPWLAHSAYSSSLPRTQSRALSEPGG